MPPAGDSSLTQMWYELGQIKRVVLDVLFDSGDGSFAATALNHPIDGFLLRLVTNPGATAPTTLYDITLVDDAGSDVLQGVGMDRSATDTEDAPIVYAGTANHPAVSPSETLTLTIANQAVVSATTQITIWYSACSD